MNSKVISILSIFTILLSADAAPIGRPITEQNQWLVGGIISYDRVDLAAKNRSFRGEAVSTLFLTEASYGFSEDGEFYLRLGLSEEKFKAGRFMPNLSSKLDWAIGVRGTIYDSYQNWRLIGDLQWMARPGRNYNGADLDYTEWQVATGMEYRLTNEIFPYGGIYYQDMEIHSNNQGTFPSVESVKNIGLFVGVGYEPSPRWLFFDEGRATTGSSVTGGVNYRF